MKKIKMTGIPNTVKSSTNTVILDIAKSPTKLPNPHKILQLLLQQTHYITISEI